MPKARTVARILFASLDDGCATVQRLLQEGMVPSIAEIMDHICLEAVARHRRLDLPEAARACVLIEVDGEDATALAAQTARIRAVAAECGSLEFREARDRAEVDDLWAVRRSLSQALIALAPDRLGEDISVPRGAFPEVVRRIEAISRRHGLLIPIFGHAGDGNLHPGVLCDLATPGEHERVERVVSEIFDAALALGGTLTGEHGVGVTKRPYLARALGEPGVAALRAVKGALDPTGILNPGKMW